MPLQIVNTGFRTILFTDKPNGPPKVDTTPDPVRFSAARIAAQDVPPSVVYETIKGVDPLPVRPISDTPPP